jgi:hypothetical protein
MKPPVPLQGEDKKRMRTTPESHSPTTAYLYLGKWDLRRGVGSWGKQKSRTAAERKGLALFQIPNPSYTHSLFPIFWISEASLMGTLMTSETRLLIS